MWSITWAFQGDSGGPKLDANGYLAPVKVPLKPGVPLAMVPVPLMTGSIVGVGVGVGVGVRPAGHDSAAATAGGQQRKTAKRQYSAQISAFYSMLSLNHFGNMLIFCLSQLIL